MDNSILHCPYCNVPMIENIEHDFTCPKCNRFCFGKHHLITETYGRKPKRIKISLFNRKFSSGEYDY